MTEEQRERFASVMRDAREFAQYVIKSSKAGWTAEETLLGSGMAFIAMAVTMKFPPEQLLEELLLVGGMRDDKAKDADAKDGG